MDERPEVIQGGISVDDRGQVSFVNDFNFHGVKRFYTVSNHQAGYIRAWHGHIREAKYAYVPCGAALVGAVDLDDNEVFVKVLSANKPSIMYVPSNHANGFKSLTSDTVVMFFSLSTLEETQGDDIRFSYDKWNIWEEDYR